MITATNKSPVIFYFIFDTYFKGFIGQVKNESNGQVRDRNLTAPVEWATSNYTSISFYKNIALSILLTYYISSFETFNTNSSEMFFIPTRPTDPTNQKIF